MARRTIVFTDRRDYDTRYAAAVKGGCRINFCELQPAEAAAHAVVEEKQETVFANTLRGFDSGAWSRLISLLAEHRFRTSSSHVAELAGRRLKTNAVEPEDAGIGAIINNLVPPILRLHDPNSQLLNRTLDHLRRDGFVILDLSMLSSADAGRIAAWVLNRNSPITSVISPHPMSMPTGYRPDTTA